MQTTAAPLTTSEHHSRLETDGYLVIPGVLTAAEIERLREGIEAALAEGNGLVGDVLSTPQTSWLLHDPRIAAIVRTVVGQDACYFGMTQMQAGDPGDVKHLHVDRKGDAANPRTGQSLSDPALVGWPVIRMGIYLQDHAHHSGGLKVRRGSHRKFLPDKSHLIRMVRGRHRLSWRGIPIPFVNRLVSIPSRPGDIVLFNLGAHHSGGFMRLRFAPWVAFPPKVESWLERALPRWCWQPTSGDRHILFIDFATPSPHTTGYRLNRALHPTYASHWERTHIDEPALREPLEALGITVDTTALEAFRAEAGAKA